MKFRISLFLISILQFSCSNDRIGVNIQTNGKIVLIDSTSQTENLLKYHPQNRHGYYPIYYIGKLNDTIHLGQRKIPGYKFEQKDYSNIKYFTLPDSTKLRLFVDTLFSLTHKVFYSHYSERDDKEIIDSTISFKAYPVFVYNLCDSMLLLGEFSEIGYTVRQGKDESGNWVDIETRISYYCGTGARQIVIEPSQLLVAKVIRYDGDFKTECRLKYSIGKSTVYSNIFTDYIDKKQLTDPFPIEF